MLGRERKRGSATGRVADEMETLETVSISLAENPLHLGIEAEVRRGLVPRVDLEGLFHERVDTLAERLKQRCVCKRRRHHATRQKHHRVPSRHGREPTRRLLRSQSGSARRLLYWQHDRCVVRRLPVRRAGPPRAPRAGHGGGAWFTRLTAVKRPGVRSGDALHAIGAAGVEGALGDEVVVVGVYVSARKPAASIVSM